MRLKCLGRLMKQLPPGASMLTVLLVSWRVGDLVSVRIRVLIGKTLTVFGLSFVGSFATVMLTDLLCLVKCVVMFGDLSGTVVTVVMKVLVMLGVVVETLVLEEMMLIVMDSLVLLGT